MEPSLSSDRPRYHEAAQTQISAKARVEISPAITIENVHEIFQKLTQHITIEQKTDPKNGESGKEKTIGESTEDGVMSMDSTASSASILKGEQR